MPSILYCPFPDLFDLESLDKKERVFLDQHCHGLIEWCTLHPRRQNYEGLCWIKPRLSRFDHVMIAPDKKAGPYLKKIVKFLGTDSIHLFLLKSLSSASDYSEAQSLFEKVEWVADLHEENPFVGN